MGILDDLAMGFGLKARTQDYDARTARAIALEERYGDDHIAQMRARQGYITTSPDARATPIGLNDAGRMQYQYGYDVNSGAARRFLDSRDGPGYNPARIPRDQDNRSFVQRALFSPQSDLMSPKPYAIGPLNFDGPLRIPGILGMITGGLFGQQDREIPTVSADSGPMRVRPNVRSSGPTYGTTPYEIGNSGAGMDYVTPAPSGPQYTGAKDYALGYGIDSPLLDFRPTTADVMESHIPLDSEVETTDYGPGDDNTMSFEEYVESVSAIDNVTGAPVDKSPEAMRKSFERFLKRTGMQERVFDPIKYNYEQYKAQGGDMPFEEFKARQGG